MSLWQGTRWTQRANQSTPGIHAPTRTPLSGNSSAATSTVSLASSNSSTAPRRPLNQLNLRQEKRSNSIPRVKPIETTKSDHDPVQTLAGILGELPDSPVHEPEKEKDSSSAVEGMRKIDAGGRTLQNWLEELEKDKSKKLATDIEQRTIHLRIS
jgi:hypothetical protein